MNKKGLERKVMFILENFPTTRKDDYFLIYEVQKLISPGIKNMTYSEVMKNHKELGLPSFESITRCRRKICETRQDLIDYTQAVIRAEEKEEFKEYSRS